MTQAGSRDAVEELVEVFGTRVARADGDGWTSVKPKDAREVSRLVGIAARHGIPLRPVGGATVAPAPEREAISISFDLMAGASLPEPEEGWVDAEPGASMLRVGDLLRARGRDLTVYPTSAPRATVGGWLATDGAGVGSFEFGRARENFVSATVVSAAGDLFYLSGRDPGVLNAAEGAGAILVGARLRTRPADDDLPFGAAFPDASSLAGAVGALVSSRPPLWHVAVMGPGVARAVDLAGGFRLFGAYPAARAPRVGALLDSAVRGNGGEHLDAREARRTWAERFFPVTPRAASVPEARRETVAPADLARVLGEHEARGVLWHGSVSRSGMTVLLSFGEGGG